MEKAEPGQVRFTLRLRDQRSMWMQDGCQVFLHGIEWIMFHGHLDSFQKSSLWGRPNTKPGDHGTPNTYNRWFILFYHVWGPAWIEVCWNSIWLRARSCMASHLHLRVCDHTTRFWRCVGTTLGHFSFGVSQCHGHGSWFVCEVALSDRIVWSH